MTEKITFVVIGWEGNINNEYASSQWSISQFRIQLQFFNLVPRAHVSFGQRQDTELWNNQFPETKKLGLPVSQRMRALV